WDAGAAMPARIGLEVESGGKDRGKHPRRAARFSAGSAVGSPDHRHTGAADRIDGRGRLVVRSAARRHSPESKICRQVRPLSPGVSMIRLLAPLALLILMAPALAQVQLPPGADPQNTLLIDTKYAPPVINLRNDIAPKPLDRINLPPRTKNS